MTPAKPVASKVSFAFFIGVVSSSSLLCRISHVITRVGADVGAFWIPVDAPHGQGCSVHIPYLIYFPAQSIANWYSVYDGTLSVPFAGACLLSAS